ncbi:MAG: hypothetical protein J6P31_02860 [Oscillospiraceae bacterium]|nr:hypothetical protein [Oscillospiraceae bacterium]
MRNPSWRAYYENAPGARLKRHIAATFEYGGTFDPDGRRDSPALSGAKKPYEPLRETDLAYMLAHAENGMYRSALKKQLSSAGRRDHWITALEGTDS